MNFIPADDPNENMKVARAALDAVLDLGSDVGLESCDLGALTYVLGQLTSMTADVRSVALRIAHCLERLDTGETDHTDVMTSPITACLLAERTLDAALESLHSAFHDLRTIRLDRRGEARDDT